MWLDSTEQRAVYSYPRVSKITIHSSWGLRIDILGVRRYLYAVPEQCGFNKGATHAGFGEPSLRILLGGEASVLQAPGFCIILYARGTDVLRRFTNSHDISCVLGITGLAEHLSPSPRSAL